MTSVKTPRHSVERDNITNTLLIRAGIAAQLAVTCISLVMPPRMTAIKNVADALTNGKSVAFLTVCRSAFQPTRGAPFDS